MRLYNVSHKSVGKTIKQGDSFMLAIPPVGSFVEVDDRHERKLRLIVDKSFGRLSLTPPFGQNPVKQAENIVDLQAQLKSAMEEIARLKNLVEQEKDKAPETLQEPEELEEAENEVRRGRKRKEEGVN